MNPHYLSLDQIEFANQKIDKLLKKEAIEKCHHEPGERKRWITSPSLPLYSLMYNYKL